MNRKTKALLGLSHAVVLVMGLAAGLTLGGLLGLYVHASTHLSDLEHRAAYSTPEQAMQSLVAESYVGIRKMEIVYANRELFDDLWFVKVHVWATGRGDGQGFAGREYDNPGSYFLRLKNGWVLVPESRGPILIALGKWLFGLAG